MSFTTCSTLGLLLLFRNGNLNIVDHCIFQMSDIWLQQYGNFKLQALKQLPIHQWVMPQ